MAGPNRVDVWLVGGGPGDPDLLTGRGRELLAAASHVVADPEVAELARAVVGSGASVEVIAAPTEAEPTGADPTEAEPTGAEPTGARPTAAGTTARWPHTAGFVRLYTGDGVDASAGDRAALDAAGRTWDLVPGVSLPAAAAADAVTTMVPARRPLAGLAVVVTRPAHQAEALAAPLRRAGARVVTCPTIHIGPPADGGVALAAALAVPERYRWLIVTSANGAHAVLADVPDARRLAGVGVAAIGPATAAVLRAGHVGVDLVPAAYVAEALLAEFPAPTAGADRVLIARAAVARDVLPEGLRAAGWTVDVVEAYRTASLAVDPAVLDTVATAEVVTFTSPSTVTGFVAAVGGPANVPPVVACIGPVTAAAAEAAGLTVTVTADPYTVDGLVAAVVAHSGRSS